MRINDLFEAFSSTPEFKWGGGHATKYSSGTFDTSFEVSGEKYLVDISQNHEPEVFEPEVWCVSFRQSRIAGYRPTGNMGSEAAKVLGGIIHSIEDFISTHQPDAIGLTGKHEHRLGHLYGVMAKHLAKRIASLGYQVFNTRIDGLEVILLYRTGQPEDYIQVDTHQSEA